MRRQNQLRFVKEKKIKAIKKIRGKKEKQGDLSWRRVSRMQSFCKHLKQVKQIENNYQVIYIDVLLKLSNKKQALLLKWDVVFNFSSAMLQ